MLRRRAELVLALVFGLAAAATAVWPTWLEQLTGLDPDAGSGATEWWLVALLGLVSLLWVAVWRLDLRLSQPVSRPTS